MAIQFVDRVPTYPGRIKFTKEDGTVIYGVWERADSPTVEGTPLNAANLNAMQEGAGLSSAVNIYVSTTGSDTTGTGTESAPFATITKALSTLPKFLNGFNPSVYVSSGTYREVVRINNFVGGTVRLRGSSSAATIYGLTIQNSVVETTGLTLTLSSTGDSNAALYMDGGRYRCYNEISITSSATGAYLVNGAQLLLTSSPLTLSGNSYGIRAEHGSFAYISSIEGSAQTVIDASGGAIVTYGTLEASSTASVYSIANGGRVYTEGQTSAPNY